MQTIQGKKFILRKWKMADVEFLVKHANNENIAKNLRDGFPYPYTIQDARSWIDMIINNSKDLVYAIEINGEACGGIGLHGMKDVYRYNAEIGYWLSERHWGKGIMTEAVCALVNVGFEQYKWTRIYAGVFSSNISSMRVLEKAGFKEEARFKNSIMKRGVVQDEHVWSILKEDWMVTTVH